ncbi:hypothetical protein, variant [Saprolegnia diclina VS20]|uniref:Bromo domain-containing protein n=1 Tax=Saprolegnia diclina (strain VS20) TaxID=1156394 RepID=T0RME0_SAPDV|nr:hypothetical protein, variant [Saprolegnia diclina VS20]EQC33458.1 hypothetical protein, variant [Saprolegnia diclina VS20]|eukprot:XP_008613098.1 hypothetical protein, variant [Saprolegnia diclina VS20]
MAARESLRSQRARGTDPKKMAQEMMLHVLRELVKKDAYDFFGQPVDTSAVPDYLEKIATPMDFATIQTKITRHEYDSFDAFKLDVVIVFNNAQNYNVETTAYFREALRLEAAAIALFVEAEARMDENRALYNRSGAFPSSQTPPKRRRVASPTNAATPIRRPPLPEPRSPDDANTPMFDLGVLLPAFAPTVAATNTVVQPIENVAMPDVETEMPHDFFHDLTLSDLDHSDDEASFVFDDVVHAPPTRANDGDFMYDEESIHEIQAPSQESLYADGLKPSQDGPSNPLPPTYDNDEVSDAESEDMAYCAPVPHVEQPNVPRRKSPLQKENQFPSATFSSKPPPTSTSSSGGSNGWLQSKRAATQAPKSQALWPSTAKKTTDDVRDPNDLFGVKARQKRQPRQVLLDKFIQSTPNY